MIWGSGGQHQKKWKKVVRGKKWKWDLENYQGHQQPQNREWMEDKDRHWFH